MIITCPGGVIAKIGELVCIVSRDGKKKIFIDLNKRKELYVNGDNSLYMICADYQMMNSISGVYSTSHTVDYFVTTYVSKMSNFFNHVSNFFNRKTKLSIITTIKCDNDVKHTSVNKDGLRAYFHDDYKTMKRRVISECMVNGGDGDEKEGLRFRGVYNNETDITNGKILYKTLTKDDEYVYIKKGDDVLVNNVVEDTKCRTSELIGWKIGENAYGEKRIIKLAIMPDARIVRPVDEEFFHTKGKERCDKAIVIDIQYPDEEKEQSVVPDEMTAYSFLFQSATPFEYRVGKEVTPNSFDENDNVSCTHGIHYYCNRKSVFDVYVNR